MKTGKSLQDLAREIERRANAKKDVVVSTKHLMMIVDEANQAPALRIGGGNDYFDVGANTIAHAQIAEHTEIPKKYYDRMLTSDPYLLAANVNVWFGKEPVPRMVRMLDGTARAFLSNRFRPLENEELATAVLPALLEMDLAVMSSEITDKRLYIKAVDRRVERELKAVGGKFGDGGHNIVRCLSPAITISNSEVGLGALSILGGVYDGFCSNLATFGERSTRKYHVGGKHEIGGEDTYALLSDDTRRKTNDALWSQVTDIVKAAFQRASFDSLCDKIAETASQKIDGDPVKVISLATKRFGMTEGEGTSILRHLIQGGDLSRFGLYNAVTRASQDLPDYDRATEFERFGANVIELPATEWREMAMAA